MESLRPSCGRSLVTAAILLFAALPPAGAAALASPACRLELLTELGWLFDRGPVESPQIRAGMPCERADLADAWASGDLRMVIPTSTSLLDHPELLDELLQHPATRCGYLFRLGAATRRAADRLAGNPGYRFTWFQTGWIAFGFGGPSIDGWRPIASFGRGFVPAGSNWRAIEGFYSGRVRSECGVGRQIAQYAAQAELYGPRGFDDEFDAGEIVIGRFTRLHSTASILLGSGAGELVRDGLAKQASRQGRQALVGLPGFIVHSLERSRLDDINNQAQNFVIYDVDGAAAEALRQHGGFAHFNRQARRLWELAGRLAPGGRRHFEQLLAERDERLRSALTEHDRRIVAELDELLSDPFFRGVRIYVHRHGIKPVGYHFVRMLDRNPRTPFQIELALHNLHTTLYQRFLRHRLVACEHRRSG